MPPLSKSKNCRYCASFAHKSDLCPRVDRSAAPTAAKPAPKIARAAATAATKAATKAANQVKAAMKRAAQHDAVTAQRAQVAQVQAVHVAVHAALVGVGVPILTTPGNYRHSNWTIVNDLCVACRFPPRRCMCIKK